MLTILTRFFFFITHLLTGRVNKGVRMVKLFSLLMLGVVGFLLLTHFFNSPKGRSTNQLSGFQYPNSCAIPLVQPSELRGKWYFLT